MKKIIHLSDLHIGYQETSDILRGMIDRLIYLYEPASDYIVVITGDIVDDVTKGDQLEVARSHINRIKGAGFDLLIVPGNHDYGTGSDATSSGMAKYKKEIYGEADAQFPRFDRIGDIAFIGLDSMEGEIRKRQGALADGEIGTAQLNKLESLLSSNEVASCQYKVVYLHHHPIDPGGFFKKIVHGLDDAKELKKVLSRHVIDALLFGHNHEGKPWNGNWGIKRAYDAGSSTGKKSVQGPHRVIDLSLPPYTDFDAKL